ncbi:MAG: type II secretion system F family protein [Firmicutes bacterium]|nr:type II secretion system F family protein [Bacillota bacterium]
MPTFRYVAKNMEGETDAGTLSAPDLRGAVEQLRARDLFVISIREHGAGLQHQEVSLEQIRSRIKAGKKPKSRDFMVFCRQFATMLQAGITVLQILKIQAQQAENDTLKEKLRDVALDVERGGALAGALAKHGDFFPRIIVSMVEAGEAGGILDTVMERLAEHFQNQHDLEEKIRSSTMYPIIVSALAIVVMAVMVFFVLPTFAKIFEEMGVDLPFFTSALIGLSRFLLRYWYLILGLLLLSAVLLYRYARTPQGRRRFDQLRLRLPVYGKIYSTAIVARFSRTLGTLLSSGVGLVTALELVEKVINNIVLSDVMIEARRVIRQGQMLALPLAASGLFPPMLVEMVHIGEESGALDGMLSRTADFYEGELTFILDRLSTIIEPVLLIGVGLFVALLLISIIQPLFGIYELI